MCRSSSRRRSRPCSWRRSSALEQHLRDARSRKRRDGAGLEAGRCDDLVRPRDARVARAGGRRDLRRVRAPVAGNEREHRPAVADEDERLDDLRGLAADRVRRRRGRRRAVAGTPRAARRCRARAGRPRRAPPAPASALPSSLDDRAELEHARVVEALGRGCRSTSRPAGSESTVSTISALPPRRERETVMFAMLTPASPNTRADPADHAGHVVVAEEHEQRRELELELEAERVHEPLAVVAADRRARDARLLVAGADLDAQEVRVVARRLRALLAHLDAALARDRAAR